MSSPGLSAVADRYRRFADSEAPGRSARYAEWARGVAGDRALQEILARIPAGHRQPPLVFAVTRLLGAPEEGFGPWASWLRSHADDVVAESSRRLVQTNEPLRCAALLPALAGIPGPLALLEVGASAGLCLYPDRYSYRYAGGPTLDPSDGPSAVVLSGALRGTRARELGMRLALPEVVWRGGIDLAPLDAAAPADRRFLETLVWPGEEGRRERITAALDLVRQDPPMLWRGDATEPAVLAEAVAGAPPEATLVVTTPGVLPHIPRPGRERLRDQLASLVRTGRARWVTIAPAGMEDQWRPRLSADSWTGFVLGRDGGPLAEVDPLGAHVDWRAG
jgi:hypothetical protein